MTNEFENLSTGEQIRFLIQSQKSLGDNIEKLYELVEKHEHWQQKVERSLVAGIEAALRAWRNGENSQ